MSGLPGNPTNWKPLAPYTDEQLGEFLAGFKLDRDPGDEWEYSNLGYALLGRALAKRLGMSFEELLRKRIIVPLKMANTFITVDSENSKNLALGHTAKLERSQIFDLPMAAPAGSIRSSANDLLKLLGAFMKYQKSPLNLAMDDMFKTRRRAGPDFLQELGWIT